VILYQQRMREVAHRMIQHLDSRQDPLQACETGKGSDQFPRGLGNGMEEQIPRYREISNML